MARKAQGGGRNNLQAWREKRELTQAKLAEKIGTTGAVISLLESGDRPLSDKWLYRLSDALDISPGWLYDLHPDDVSDDLLSLFRQIAPEDRNQVAEVMRTFIRRRNTR